MGPPIRYQQNKTQQGFGASCSRLLIVTTIAVLTLWAAGLCLSVYYLPDAYNSSVVTRGRNLVRSAPVESAPINFCSPWPSCTLPPRPPKYETLCDVLDKWSPNDPHRPLSLPPSSSILPRFNFSDPVEAHAAEQYRVAEFPFLVYDIPDLNEARQTWDRNYIRSAFRTMRRNDYKIEQSRMSGNEGKNNTFLYYSGNVKKMKKHGFAPPQVPMGDLDYDSFDAATEMAGSAAGVDDGGALLYATIGAGQGGQTRWIRDALPFLVGDGSVDPEPTLFIPFPSRQDWKGINCRFGMRGVVQTAHYDGHRNMIAMITGSKRYVISPPEGCEALELYERGHPSARHASFDWADPKERRKEKRADGPFCKTPALDIVLEAGNVLYLPSYWFHYIVSLDRSIQCNSRSGDGTAGRDVIRKCGF